ncbi:MAG: ROK family protein [Candidatus Glassbacteria bacterium]|nr:ROK family protein [Candidatus Glassbacteria bacterium]
MKFDPDNFIAADHKIMRSINRSNVLNIVREKGPISRVEISKLVGLKKPAVSSIVQELIGEGLVYEDSRGQSSVGRKPITLKINESARIAGVIDVSRTETTLAICDLGRNVLEKEVVETVSGDGKKFFNLCGRTIARMAGSCGERMAGVGVSVPALVSHTDGIIYLAYTNKWNDVNVKQIVEGQVKCKVCVENDAKAGAIAELWFGKEAGGLSDFAFILVCEGIGVGLVINRSLYHGSHSLAGEFGKQIICSDPYGEKSPQSQYWENMASDLSIVRRYAEYSGKHEKTSSQEIEQTMQKVIDLALGDDPFAVRALKEASLYLGIGIANMHSGLDPEKIIIGGKIVQAWNLISKVLSSQLEKLIPHKQVQLHNLVVPSSLASPTFEGAQAMVHREVYRSVNIP